MKNKIVKTALATLAFGSESTLGYLYSLIGPDHGGIITQVEQDLFVKASFKLLCLALSFLAAHFALCQFIPLIVKTVQEKQRSLG
ncbi:MAG: hypothetical protein ONB44_06595 [candidate division KSB1 bacterium]|nr:hypothetical protein [candidate division KSB1 bacterium]MDZ7301792.1 hypothetical protein [candidate division KSB1 bacterium]MDZ7311429.1 hypothetical protein [candidate division KSB1 bacterium]